MSFTIDDLAKKDAELSNTLEQDHTPQFKVKFDNLVAEFKKTLPNEIPSSSVREKIAINIKHQQDENSKPFVDKSGEVNKTFEAVIKKSTIDSLAQQYPDLQIGNITINQEQNTNLENNIDLKNIQLSDIKSLSDWTNLIVSGRAKEVVAEDLKNHYNGKSEQEKDEYVGKNYNTFSTEQKAGVRENLDRMEVLSENNTTEIKEFNVRSQINLIDLTLNDIENELQKNTNELNETLIENKLQQDAILNTNLLNETLADLKTNLTNLAENLQNNKKTDLSLYTKIFDLSEKSNKMLTAPLVNIEEILDKETIAQIQAQKELSNSDKNENQQLENVNTSTGIDFDDLFGQPENDEFDIGDMFGEVDEELEQTEAIVDKNLNELSEQLKENEEIFDLLNYDEDEIEENLESTDIDFIMPGLEDEELETSEEFVLSEIIEEPENKVDFDISDEPFKTNTNVNLIMANVPEEYFQSDNAKDVEKNPIINFFKNIQNRLTQKRLTDGQTTQNVGEKPTLLNRLKNSIMQFFNRKDKPLGIDTAENNTKTTYEETLSAFDKSLLVTEEEQAKNKAIYEATRTSTKSVKQRSNIRVEDSRTS